MGDDWYLWKPKYFRIITCETFSAPFRFRWYLLSIYILKTILKHTEFYIWCLWMLYYYIYRYVYTFLYWIFDNELIVYVYMYFLCNIYIVHVYGYISVIYMVQLNFAYTPKTHIWLYYCPRYENQTRVCVRVKFSIINIISIQIWYYVSCYRKMVSTIN